jgi:hypothetical protein
MEASGQLHALAASRPGKYGGVHWLGSRMGSRVFLGALEERNVCCSNPWTSVSSPTAKPTTLSWLSHLTRSITNNQSENSSAWEHFSTHDKVLYNTSKAERVCVAIIFRTCTGRMTFPYIGWVTDWPDNGLSVSFFFNLNFSLCFN